MSQISAYPADPTTARSFSRDTVATRRRVSSVAFKIFALGSLALVAAPTFWVLYGVVSRALPGWRWSVLTTPTSGEGGGLENALLGTFVLVAAVWLFAGTIGILSGLYLSEYASPRVALVLRSASEVLAGVPSIVIGYVGYVALVVGLQWHFSLLAGTVALSVMVVPYITRYTEVSLNQVPTPYREGAAALGIREPYALRRIVLRAAMPGIATGLLLASAIAIGETAPLLLTAGWTNQLPSLHLHQPVAYLTYLIWTFYNMPSISAVQLSFDAALLLIVMVIVLILLSRVILWLTQKNSEARGR